MLIKESVAADGGFQVGDFFPSVEILSVINGQKYKLDKIHRELDWIFEVIIYEHKVRREAIKTSESEGDEDLVDVLLRVQENSELEFPIIEFTLQFNELFGAFFFISLVNQLGL